MPSVSDVPLEEEMKVVWETQKIFGEKDMRLNVPSRQEHRSMNSQQYNSRLHSVTYSKTVLELCRPLCYVQLLLIGALSCARTLRPRKFA